MNEIVILGGGFSGVWAAMAAAAQRHKLNVPNIAITLITKEPSLCIKPRLYEGAKRSMLVPLKGLLEEIEVSLKLDTVETIGNNSVKCVGNVLQYDRLIFALGSYLNTSKISGAAKWTYNIDTYSASLACFRHIEKIINSTHEKKPIVHIIGTGFTGIELVTQLHKRYGQLISLTLVEKENELAKSLGMSIQKEVDKALKSTNVEVLLNHEIESYGYNEFTLVSGETITSDAMILATGPTAHQLTTQFAVPCDERNRLIVDRNLKLARRPSVYAVGDSSKANVDDSHYSQMSCQHAMPMGVYAGINAVNGLCKLPELVYEQPYYATCIDLGNSGAVFTQGWERTIVKTGEDGQSMKEQINRQWIYPPDPEIGKLKIFDLIQEQISH